MFELAYASGLRAEELVSLRIADVDHDGEQLRVEGKGRKTRFVPVGEPAMAAVRAYLDLRTPEGVSLPVPPYVVCIGPTTTDNARAMGLSGVDTAWGASAAGIVAVLVDHFAEHQGDAS